jgi:hypothetical protein
MYPCGVLRWGGNIHSAGLACPAEWRNRLIEVPGYGVRRCDDTPARGYINGLPHVDLRVSSFAEARRIGIQRMTIYAADGRVEGIAEAPAPSPTAERTPEQVAIQWATQIETAGDPSTAMAALIRGKTARETFPALVEGINLTDEQSVWAVTLWVPESAIPAGTVARPDSGVPVAARFLLLDPESGALIGSSYASKDVLDIMGWLPSLQ